jgi:hypothetical protein
MISEPPVNVVWLLICEEEPHLSVSGEPTWKISSISVEGAHLDFLQGFLPEAADNFATTYVYPAFSPTLGLFLLISVIYGLVKVSFLTFVDIISRVGRLTNTLTSPEHTPHLLTCLFGLQTRQGDA